MYLNVSAPVMFTTIKRGDVSSLLSWVCITANTVLCAELCAPQCLNEIAQHDGERSEGLAEIVLATTMRSVGWRFGAGGWVFHVDVWLPPLTSLMGFDALQGEAAVRGH